MLITIIQVQTHVFSLTAVKQVQVVLLIEVEGRLGLISSSACLQYWVQVYYLDYNVNVNIGILSVKIRQNTAISLGKYTLLKDDSKNRHKKSLDKNSAQHCLFKPEFIYSKSTFNLFLYE